MYGNNGQTERLLIMKVRMNFVFLPHLAGCEPKKIEEKRVNVSSDKKLCQQRILLMAWWKDLEIALREDYTKSMTIQSP